MRLAAKLITLFAAFVLVTLLIVRFWVLPPYQISGTTVAALRLTGAAIEFQKEHGHIPGQSNGDSSAEVPPAEAVVAALRGDNPTKKNYLADFPDTIFRENLVLDSFGQPFHFEIGKDNILTVISPGRNGRLGDDDDIVGTPPAKNTQDK